MADLFGVLAFISPYVFIMTGLVTLGVFVAYLLNFVRCDCDPYSGPSGGVECVLLDPYYSEYQWATCLTDEYIRTKSGGNHVCRSSYVTYCYYQCMVELNNIDEGTFLCENKKLCCSNYLMVDVILLSEPEKGGIFVMHLNKNYSM